MKAFLLASQTVYALFLTVWFTVWMFSVMLFDSGVTTSSVSIVSIVSAYPVACVVCSIFAWRLFRRQRRRPSLLVNLVPAVWVVGILTLLLAANGLTG